MTIKETLMAKKINPHDLTEDEIEFLRSSRVPNEIKRYLARRHENIGTTTSAYRKVTAALRAECDARLAALDLAAIEGEAVDLERAKTRVQVLERQNLALEHEINKRDSQLKALKAAPAMAVHS